MKPTRLLRGGRAALSTGLGLLALFSPLPGLAENNTDYIYNGTSTNTGTMWIPVTSPGTNNSLQILNGGAVTNTYGGLSLGAGDNYN